MTARKHDVEVVSDFVTGDYIAHCTCGWESEPEASNDEALAQWRHHADQEAS